ncbi:MAG: 3-deoxy-manno-octulosonate cytidylyltransferase [Muribaculaceae bacterium]|nr:3-deoxy-manno-octulosonate cytidylyltransferase [Muribaculaceae bacterium]
MKFIVLIPARYESTRFPGKPLALIGGVEMIVRVCRQVAKTGFPLAVATDSEAIRERVEKAGFKAVMTSPSHRSGTERVEEAYRVLGSDADVVINVQGDEPFINPEQIMMLADMFRRYENTDIATLARKFDPEAGFDALSDPNLVKLVMSEHGEALYFSRSVIPYLRKYPREEWLSNAVFYSHIGIYAYRSSVLSEIVKLPESPLETAESLEQLRWLQNGYGIRAAVSAHPTIGIDTPDDLEKAQNFLMESGVL